LIVSNGCHYVDIRDGDHRSSGETMRRHNGHWRRLPQCRYDRPTHVHAPRYDPTAEFTSQHPQYRRPIKDGKLTVKLNKTLYGCVQSGKLWYDHFTGMMKQMGFAPNPIDPCVFNKRILDDIIKNFLDSDLQHPGAATPAILELFDIDPA
jgi:hypothetical protein